MVSTFLQARHQHDHDNRLTPPLAVSAPASSGPAQQRRATTQLHRRWTPAHLAKARPLRPCRTAG